MSDMFWGTVKHDCEHDLVCLWVMNSMFFAHRKQNWLWVKEETVCTDDGLSL